MDRIMIPDPPNITPEDMQKCRDAGDFSPVLYEWYIFVACLCVVFSNLLQDTPVIRTDISKRDYGILIGLINRIARIMRANLELSQKSEFGESTAILDRSIFESSVILTWLCKSPKQDRFDRYIASGLKTELEMRDQLQKAINARNGAILNIEKRMLQSVEECLAEAGFDENKIMNTKGMPDMASMLESLGHPRFSYTAGQRISSHHVHGTWVGLRNHYIQLIADGSYRTKQFTPTHVNQYVYISFVVLDALACFVDYVFVSCDSEKKTMLDLFKDTAKEISTINDEVIGSDYELYKNKS